MHRRSQFSIALFLLCFMIGVQLSLAQENGTIRVFADSQTLTVLVTGDQAVSLKDIGFQVASEGGVIHYLRDYNDIKTIIAYDVPVGACVRLSRPANEANVAPLPTACKTVSTQALNDADVFWFDTVQNQRLAFAVIGGEGVNICDNSSPYCDINLPTPPKATAVPSPDTDQIAFLSDRTGKTDIYLMDSDGQNVRDLSNTPDANEIRPTWSPDGTQITYHSDANVNDPQIYVLDVSSLQAHNVTNSDVNDFVPAWSPDGTQIAFVSFPGGKGDIFTIQPNGTNLRRVTHLETSGCSLDNPSWSPDGKIISYSSNCVDGNHEIYFADAQTGEVTRITNNTTDEYTPVWSPDGKQIAFGTSRDGNAEIYVMNADGTDAHNVSNNSADDYAPDWSPDGTKIAFNSYRNGNWDIYTMNADGSNVQQITTDPGTDDMPAWRPRPKS